MNWPVELLAADVSGDSMIGDSMEAETEELAVHLKWYDGSPRMSNAHKGGPFPLPEPPLPAPNSSSGTLHRGMVVTL
jgi:hypothetical protein